MDLQDSKNSKKEIEENKEKNSTTLLSEDDQPDEFYSTHKWEMVRDMDDGDWEF